MAKLLLADDSITIQKVVELVLADEGFEIKAVGNGADALTMLESFMPDVILADIEMPKMNGYQLCEKVKANPATRNVPVILLAGAFEPLDEELAKNVGADDFLIKPFESEDLIKKVNSVRASEPAEAGFEVAEAVPEPSGEDLWGIEGLGSHSAEEAISAEEIVGAEEVMEAEAVSEAEEVFGAIPVEEMSPEFGTAQMPEFEMEAEPVRSRPSVPPAGVAMPQFSSADVIAVFKKAAEENIASMNLKEAVSAELSAAVKDSVEKVLWEVAPELIERLIKGALKDTVESLSKQVEKIIWETVPDMAENIIRKEIEKIKSGL